MSVFVLDRHRVPLMPCSEKRARLLLERGRAVVHRRIPFSIRLKDRTVEQSELQPITIGIDPGSKTTGIAVARESEEVNVETGESEVTRHPLMLINLEHKGAVIRKRMEQRAALRRSRRSRNLRYRAPRFLNRTKPQGWLAPSLQHRVDSILSWVNRITRYAPVTLICQELVRFDTQRMENGNIQGAEYQQGTLAGYEVREYLLEKWGRKCAYCGAEGVPLEIEHIHPKSKGGSHRISNLTLACRSCNQHKGNRPVEEFLDGKPEVLKRVEAQAKRPLHDAAAMNATRWALFQALKETGLAVKVGSGGLTKYNRTRLNIRKDHYLDALCVGHVDVVSRWNLPMLGVKCSGRGAYKRTRLTKDGFPRGYLMRQKTVKGFQTGDIVQADIPEGRKASGLHVGRVAIRATGNFNIQTLSGAVQGVSHRFCRLLQRADGYSYFFQPTTLEDASSSSA